MSLFSNEDLQGFSDLMEDLAYKDRCHIIRPIKVQNEDYGGFDSQEPPIDPDDPGTPCMVIANQRPIETYEGMQVTTKTAKEVSFPRGTDVRLDDILLIEGIRYSVDGVKDPTTFEVSRRVSVLVEKMTSTETLEEPTP